MPSPSLRARHITRPSQGFFFSLQNSVLYPSDICMFGLFLFSSFFFDSFSSDGVTQKLFACWENSILFSRGYFTITSLMSDARARTLMLLSLLVRRQLCLLFSLVSNFLFRAHHSERVERSIEHNTSANNTFVSHIVFWLLSRETKTINWFLPLAFSSSSSSSSLTGESWFLLHVAVLLLFSNEWKRHVSTTTVLCAPETR